MALTVFSGNSAHTMDAKGRVTVPAFFRELLGERFTISLNNEFNAIALFPAERWQKMEEDVNRIPHTDVKGMRYVRMITGNSFPNSEVDAQGRLLVPPPLRAKMGLDKNVRFVGVGQCLELWDEARYVNENEEAERISAELTEYVNERYFRPKD